MLEVGYSARPLFVLPSYNNLVSQEPRLTQFGLGYYQV